MFCDRILLTLHLLVFVYWTWFCKQAKNLLPFPVTPLDVVKIRLQAQKNPFPKGRINTFMELPFAFADSDHTPFLFFKCLSGKCFVYCNGLMDHICVCENGNSKAWYKAPGHFTGTLVNRSYTICFTIYENMNRAAQSSRISVQTVKNRTETETDVHVYRMHLWK